MKIKTLLLFITIGLVFSKSTLAFSTIHGDTLKLNWKFKQDNSEEWMPATVPGCVHTDLVANGAIANPLIGINEQSCQWIAERDWMYQCDPFDLDKKTLDNQIVRLRFNGLDTYAEVYINNTFLLKADNAFRSWEADVRNLLKEKGNVIRVLFRSAIKEGQKKIDQSNAPLPGDALRAVTRKAQYEFGWDWGPKLISSGIINVIELISFDDLVINDLYVEQKNVSEKSAELMVHFEIESAVNGNYQMKFSYDEFNDWTTEIELRKGTNQIELPIEIEWPHLWWCNEKGHAYLYSFKALILDNNRTIASKMIKTGIREIKLVTKKDSIGESFYFSLNNEPIFIKGANYIPIAYFPTSATEEDYRNLLSKCKDAHFNMLRVWGGGYYEKEIFYELCDEYGIMVWQDFMFACSMYPGDLAFLNNVREEAKEQTTRLRNHPCIALWCGNNENSEGWINWGWQANLNEKEKSILQKNYDEVFEKILRDEVRLKTTTAYWASSPLFGRGDARSMTMGDSHYWGLWHDAEDFEILKTKIPRFMTEFGMQAYPSSEVVQQMVDGANDKDRNTYFAQHQKHARGFSLMEQYIKKWYPTLTYNTSAYGELTQVVQAEGMCMGIEAQRRASPRCMGTMYWQLNDVWPSFSWSSIDSRGNEKLFFSMLKESYAPQLISWDCTKKNIDIYWISEIEKPIEHVTLNIKFYSSENTLLKTIKVENLSLSQGSHRIFSQPYADLIQSNDPKDCYMMVEMNNAAGTPFSKRTMKLVPNSDKYLVPCVTENGIGVKILK